MSIGVCDICEREDVPVSSGFAAGGTETTSCYLCSGETDPDPYGEIGDADGLPTPAAAG